MRAGPLSDTLHYSDCQMTRLQWIYIIIGLVVALSMILAVLPIGR